MIFAISAAIAGALAVTAWWMHGRITRPLARPPLSAEERAYLPNVVLIDARMSAADTPLGNTETYLDAQIVNRGPRTVRELDLQLEFFDLLNQVVLRQVSRSVRRDAAPLKPGETRSLHMVFEHMPTGWNQAPPVCTPVYVAF